MCQEPGAQEQANFLLSLAELSAGSPGFKPSSTRKQSVFHDPTTPPFTFLKERGHWSDCVICSKILGGKAVSTENTVQARGVTQLS